MNLNKVSYRRLYIACFILLIIGILFLGDCFINLLHGNYFIEFKSISDFENQNNGIIYVGSPSYPECRTIEPIIRDIAREEQIKIYYLNAGYIRPEENIESGVLQEYLLEYQVESLPTVVVMRNGIAVESLTNLLNTAGGRKANLLTALLPYKNLSNYVMPGSIIPRALLGISILFLVISLFIKSSLLSRRLYLLVISFDFCILFFARRNWGYGVAYAERYNYSGNPLDFTISIIAIAVTILSSIFFIIRIKDQEEEV